MRRNCLALVMIVQIATVLAPANSEVCCKFKANKPPMWTSIVSPELKPETSCRWQFGGDGEVTFSGEDRLIVGLHFFCPPEVIPQRGYRPLHTLDSLVAVDAQTGKTLKEISWKDVSIDRERGDVIQLFAVNNNQVLVRAGSALKLCTPNLEEIRNRYLPFSNEAGDQLWSVNLSPSAKVGVLKHSGIGNDGLSLSEDHWFSTETLADIAVETGWQYASSIAVTDNEVYYTPYKKWQPVKTREQILAQVNSSPVVHVRTRNGQSAHPLCPDCSGLPMQVMVNGLLFLGKGRKASFWLVDPQGKVVFSGHYGGPVDSARDVRAASQGNRFGFAFGHLGTSFFRTTADDAVVVFDLAKMKPALKMKVTGYSEKNGPVESWVGPRIALSPDGTQLVVMEGGMLQSFIVGKD